MSVYVDSAIHRYRSMVMCHMTADTAEELHQMADKIGVARKWFQSESRYAHYDICKGKRALAVAAGAVEVSSKAIVPIAKELRMKIVRAQLPIEI